MLICLENVFHATQQPDAPLGDDDRTGLRVLYPDPLDLVHAGSLAGPAREFAFTARHSGKRHRSFGAQVVAVDSASGAVIAGTIGGWSCTSPGPAQFDGGHNIQKLPVGHSYTVYAEPLDGAVDPSQMANAIQTLRRNAPTDAGWPLNSVVSCPQSMRNLPLELARARKQLSKTVSDRSTSCLNRRNRREPSSAK
jgi:hypothetical protein